LIEALRARLGAGGRDRPDASALALRKRLLGASPQERCLLMSAWGRIEAALGPSLAVSGGFAQVLAADRYGLGGEPCTAQEALKAAGEGRPALIDLTSDHVWWGRLLALPELRIVAALPDDRFKRPQAFLIRREASGPTGEDRSFWVTDSPAP
ncbi:hypothetical protein LTR94_033133, partial [Friedmanniomyces endolithicus]